MKSYQERQRQYRQKPARKTPKIPIGRFLILGLLIWIGTRFIGSENSTEVQKSDNTNSSLVDSAKMAQKSKTIKKAPKPRRQKVFSHQDLVIMREKLGSKRYRADLKFSSAESVMDLLDHLDSLFPGNRERFIRASLASELQQDSLLISLIFWQGEKVDEVTKWSYTTRSEKKIFSKRKTSDGTHWMDQDNCLWPNQCLEFPLNPLKISAGVAPEYKLQGRGGDSIFLPWKATIENMDTTVWGRRLRLKSSWHTIDVMRGFASLDSSLLVGKLLPAGTFIGVLDSVQDSANLYWSRQHLGEWLDLVAEYKNFHPRLIKSEDES